MPERRETLRAVGTAIDGMSVVGVETAGVLGRSVRRLGAEAWCGGSVRKC